MLPPMKLRIFGACSARSATLSIGSQKITGPLRSSALRAKSNDDQTGGPGLTFANSIATSSLGFWRALTSSSVDMACRSNGRTSRSRSPDKSSTNPISVESPPSLGRINRIHDLESGPRISSRLAMSTDDCAKNSGKFSLLRLWHDREERWVHAEVRRGVLQNTPSYEEFYIGR
jgi:hypothetical protein